METEYFVDPSMPSEPIRPRAQPGPTRTLPQQGEVTPLAGTWIETVDPRALERVLKCM